MARNDTGFKKGLFRIVWIDATGRTRAYKEEVYNLSSKELMSPLVESAAIAIREDADGLTIIHEDTGDGQVDFTTIPKGQYKIYESKKEKQWKERK